MEFDDFCLLVSFHRQKGRLDPAQHFLGQQWEVQETVPQKKGSATHTKRENIQSR